MTALIEPGEHKFTKAEYEADPVPGGSLRASVAWLLASKTPAHAHYAMTTPSERKRTYDLGSAAHEFLLGKGAGYAVIKAGNYLTKAARMARRTVYARGQVPLLEREEKELQTMVAAIRRQLRDLVDYGSLEAMPFQHNETERCIVWREDNGVWCRAALDGLSLDGDALSEFKTEGETAHPDKWIWKARKFGYIFKACFYARGLSKLGLSHSPAVRFFVAETEKPNLLSMFRVEDELLALENNRVLAAMRLYARCKAQGRWPGYSPDGYDMGLSERERMQDQKIGGNGHVSSEDIAASL